MLMVLYLFVYAAAEWYLRLKLKESGAMVKNQLKKPIQNPTMKWDLYYLYETGRSYSLSEFSKQTVYCESGG